MENKYIGLKSTHHLKIFEMDTLNIVQSYRTQIDIYFYFAWVGLRKQWCAWSKVATGKMYGASYH